MKKRLFLISIITLTLLSSTVFAQYSEVYLEQKKKEYAEFLKNHDYHKTLNYTEEELEEIPKQDRPDLANEQNILQTLDPNLGYVPKDKLILAHKITDVYTQQNKTSIPGISWTERGPDNYGGRTRALMWDPNDATGKTVFAGGVGGGLWINTDITSGATQWTAINNFWENIAITSLAYDPSNTQIMYAGTGEGFYNSDAIAGGGMWKSTDGGSSWSRLNSTTSYSYITRVAVASNGDVYASTRSSGIIRSTNGGTSWTKVLGSGVGASTNRAADIKIGADGTFYAGMGIFTTDGIYTSSDGTTWTKRNTGGSGFPTSGIKRIEIACAPSNSNIVYAIVQGSGYDVDGIYKSSDKGVNWSSLTMPTDADGGVSPDFTRSQSWYDLSIDVDPNNENTLFIGGIDLFKSTNGGSSWSQVSHWYGGFGYQEVHADQHAVKFLPGSSSKVIFGNDGGTYYTGNATAGTPTISARNNGYNVTQFYCVAINGTSGSNNMISGAQDNGTHKFNSPGMNSTFEVTGGDGAFCHIDQSNGNNQLSQYVRNRIYVTTNNWSSSSTLFNSTTGLFINPTDYDDKEDIMYSGYANGSSIRLRRIINPFGSDSQGNVIVASGSADVSHITASPYAAGGNSTVFVGTTAGDVYKVSNAQSGSPTITSIGSALPSGNISCVAIGASEQQLLVTLSNYGTVSVWETTNGGTNWTSKEGNLPDMPVRWALYNPLDYNQAFLATEVGVWTTDDLAAGSVDWSPTNTGLANVRTDMLQYRSSDRTIAAATHGRGIFTTIIPVASPPVAEFSGTPTTICEGETVTFTDLSTNTPTGWSWTFAGGTPGTSSSQNPVITYNTAGTYQVQLTASNASGSDIETKVGYITVNAIPSAAGAITGSTSECENATGIAYSINPVAGATSYAWTVPAGAAVASGQGTTNITVNFGATSGNVEVTPSNNCGNSAASNTTVTINVCGSAPVADFSGSPTTLCEGNTVSFSDLSTNVPTGWSWSFAGGTPSTSSAQNPVITYNTAGTYQVQLTASNAFGSDLETKVGYITVNVCGSTQLMTQYCGLIMPDYLNYITCDFVPLSTDYEYEIVNTGLGFQQNIIKPTQYRYLYMHLVPGILDNTTYDIRVRAKVGGIWQNYGNVCQVTTPALSPRVKLETPYCGIILNNYNELIQCEFLNSSTEYEYEITNTGLGFNQSIVKTYLARYLYMNEVPGILDNTAYDIRVRAKIGGVYTSFGATCLVTTPSTSINPSLTPGHCGKVYGTTNTYMLCGWIGGVTEYEYEVSNTSLNYIKTVVRPQGGASIRKARFALFTGIQPSTVYDVRVRAKVDGVWSSYGSTCQITTPSNLPAKISMDQEYNRETEITDINSIGSINKLELIIYPNPNQGEFVYLDLQGLEKNSKIIITDIFGKVVLQKQIQSDYGNFSETVRFNQKLNAGFYLFSVESGNQTITKKLVVQ